VQSQQLPTESQVLEDEVLPGMESADQPPEEMSERHNHGKNCSGKIRIQSFTKSFILQVYDVLAGHTPFLALRSGSHMLETPKAALVRGHPSPARHPCANTSPNSTPDATKCDIRLSLVGHSPLVA
jgi:hypothetical protein